MNYDSRTIERNMVDLNVNDAAFLQRGEYIIQDALLGTAVGACINRVPITELLWKPSPFAVVCA